MLARVSSFLRSKFEVLSSKLPWRRRRLDRETRAEFEAHLELLVERYVRSGMTPDEARQAARRQFGNVTWHREEIHVMNGVRWIDGLAQDLRYALRQLRHGLGFSAVVIATLALGIGGTTAVFSVMHAVLLAPLPYAQPGQLVRIYQQEPEKPATRRAMSAPQFRMLRDQAASFIDVGARYFREDLGLDISNGGTPQRLRVLMVTSDYFRTLRANPFRGRDSRLRTKPPRERQNRCVRSRRAERCHMARAVQRRSVGGWHDDSTERRALRRRRDRARRVRRPDRRRRGRVAPVRPRKRHDLGEQLARRIRPAADGRQRSSRRWRSSRS